MVGLLNEARNRLRREHGAEGAVLRLRAAQVGTNAASQSGGGASMVRGSAMSHEIDARPTTAQSYLGEANEARTAVLKALGSMTGTGTGTSKSTSHGLLEVMAYILLTASEVAVAELESMGLTQSGSDPADLAAGPTSFPSSGSARVHLSAMPPRGLYVTAIERASIQKGLLEKSRRSSTN